MSNFNIYKMKKTVLIMFTVFLNLLIFSSCSESDDDFYDLNETNEIEETQACCGEQQEEEDPDPPTGGNGNGWFSNSKKNVTILGGWKWNFFSPLFC